MTKLILIRDACFAKETFHEWFGGLVIDGTTYDFDTVEELLTFVEDNVDDLNNFHKIVLNRMSLQVWGRTLRFKERGEIQHKLPTESNFAPAEPDTYATIRTDRTSIRR